MDDRILAIISNTTMAAEAHYHQTCDCLSTKSQKDKKPGQNELISKNLIIQKVLQIKKSLHSPKPNSYN